MYQIQLYGNGLGDLGASDPQVVELQKALKNLSAVRGDVRIDPGAATGEVNTQTMLAVGASMDYVAAKLGRTVAGIIQAAILGAALSDDARAFAFRQIRTYAPQIRQAIMLVQATFPGQAPPTPTPGTTLPGGIPMPTAKPWYKEPVLIGAMAVGGVGLLAVILLLATGGRKKD